VKVKRKRKANGTRKKAKTDRKRCEQKGKMIAFRGQCYTKGEKGQDDPQKHKNKMKRMRIKVQLKLRSFTQSIMIDTVRRNDLNEAN
jgi:hypothetical protein